MELHLDRKLADKRVFPSINITLSGTRQEELLYGKKSAKITTMRRMLQLLSADERSELFLDKLKQTETNDEFLQELGKT